MLKTKRLLKVFISYASQDKSVVRELSRRLASEGWIDPWVDEKKLLPGQDWRLKIEEAVETSDIVIICLSTNSVSKEGFVQKELRYAREIAFEKPEETIFLIPLRLDDCTVPRGLRFYQRGDYFGETIEETYESLLEALKLRYEQKLKIEAELARREKERLEREAAEKDTREKAERGAAEKAVREKAEGEAAEKAAHEQAKREAVEKADREKAEKVARERAGREATEKAKREKAEKAERERAEKLAREKLEREVVEKAKHEKAEHEAAEKAAREKAKLIAIEKAKRERAERLAARKATITKSLTKSFTTLKSIIPKGKPFFRIIGTIGAVVALIWIGLWGMPKFSSFALIAKPSQTMTPSPTITITYTYLPPTKTPTPTATRTKTPTPTLTYTPSPTPTRVQPVALLRISNHFQAAIDVYIDGVFRGSIEPGGTLQIYVSFGSHQLSSCNPKPQCDLSLDRMIYVDADPFKVVLGPFTTNP